MSKHIGGVDASLAQQCEAEFLGVRGLPFSGDNELGRA